MKKIVVGILAHVDAGKTTLTEALLYKSGAIRNLGRVDNKNTFLDNNDIERERGITIFSKPAYFDFLDTHITIVDTPGHVDFSAEMERTLQILDYAILVISGTDGVQGHTITLWQLLKKYKIPTFVFINKMDRVDKSRNIIINELCKKFNGGFVDFNETETTLLENISLCSDEMLDEFLAEGIISHTNILDAISKRDVFPCYFGSALKLDGVDDFLQGIASYTVQPEYGEEFGARIYKISRDEQNERLTFMKITGGALKAKSVISTEKWSEKADLVRLYSGEKYELLKEAPAGTVCAVTGLISSEAGESIGKDDFAFEPVLEPVVSYKIILPDGCNVTETYRKLLMISEELPELGIVWDEFHKDISVKVMGVVQAEIFVNLVKERLGIDITLGTGNIVYKETITDVVEGVGHFEPLRHYAEVHFVMEPAERGEGIVFETVVSEDELDKNWQRLIFTNLMERKHKGVLIGAELTDVKITLSAGRAHQKHTEGGDFRQAVYRAVRQGLMQAESRILEPYYSFRMEMESDEVGKAINDIQMMGGSFNPPETVDNRSILTGIAPVSSMMEYTSQFTAFTHGLGVLSLTPAGYGYCHNEAEVIGKYMYSPEADIENTPDSVFCAHGAGFVVPWYDVFSYMHIGGSLTDVEVEAIYPKDNAEGIMGRLDEAMGTEEIDMILSRAGGISASRKSHFKKHHSDINPEARSVSYAKISKTPRQRYTLVDGYNVVFAWKELSELAKANIDAARDRLVDIMCNYQAEEGSELIVVFDAYKVKGHDVEVLDYNNIHIVYTKEAQTADAYIERFAHDNNHRYDITVVTSDGLEQVIIRGAGCRLISSREFEKVVEMRHEQTMIILKDSKI